MANVMTGAGLISKIKADFGITLYPAVERAYATRLQAVIDANPTATDEALDILLVNQLMKLSLIRNVLVQAFDDNGDGKISTVVELNTAKSALDSTVDAAQADAAAGNVSTGQTFTLTPGLDVIPGLIGSAGTASNSGNDSIYGSSSNVANTNTFTAGDIIDGGAGKDNLFVTLDGGSAGVMPAATIKNVENFFIRNVSGTAAATTFDFGNVAGEEQVWNDRSTSGVTVTNLAAGTTVGVKGNNTFTAATTASYVATAGAANIVVDGGTAATSGALTILDGAGLTSATIASTGAANTLGGIAFGTGTGTADNIKTVTIDATTNLTTGGITGVAADTTITVKGAGAVNLGAVAVNVKEVNAADNAGGVTLTMNNVATTKYVGSTGNDVITTGGVALTTGSVDAGAGTADRLVVAVNTDVDSKAKGDKYAGFEVLQVNNHAADNIVNVENLATNNSITAIRIDDGVNATGVTNLNATQAADVTIVNGNATGAITIGVKGAETAGQTDTVKASLLTTDTTTNTANPINLTGIIMAGVEKLELTGNGTVAGNTGAVTLTTTAATALDSIKLANVANANSITIAAGQTGTNLNVDVTGSGDTTVDAMLYNTTTGAAITGGAGDDTLYGSQRADIIKGGAGDDLIRGEAIQTGVITAAKGKQSDFTLSANYDVNDQVVFTFNGQAYSHTVASGATSAAAVWTALRAVDPDAGGPLGTLATALASANVTGTLTGTSLALVDSDTGAAAGNYTASFAVTDVRDVQTLTLSGVDANDTIILTVGGNTFTFTATDLDGAGAGTAIGFDFTAGANQTNKAAVDLISGGTLAWTQGTDDTGTLTLTGPASGASLTNVVTATGGSAITVGSISRGANLLGTTDHAAPTETVTQAAADAVIGLGAVAHASDELWGGDGKDTFEFYKGANLTQIDTIKDLNLGTNAAAGQVDVLKFQTTGSPTVTLVELSTSQAATVTGKATFVEAVNAALAVVNGLGNVAQFTYGASNDTYVVFNGDGNVTFDAGSDYVVKITGVVGTLDASDIAVFAV